MCCFLLAGECLCPKQRRQCSSPSAGTKRSNMLQKLALASSVLVLGSSLLTGCAQMMEGIYSAGQDTPSDAPPGHWSFVLAQRFERDNNLSFAASNYCNAAKLGHPKAKSKCVNISYRAALDDPWDICKAQNFDKKADQICTLIINGKKDQAKKEIKAEINKAIRKKRTEERIQKGEFVDFKVEEF